MPTGHRSRAVLPLLILVALAPAGWADEERDARLARLRSMPRPQREALARNLETFDRLGPAEQAAIRDLDRRIAEADPVDRKRYYEVLRRYHLWLQTLTPEQRQALAAAPPDRRLDLIARYRAEQAKAPPRRETIDLVQIALSPLGLWQTALQLKIWFSITPAERKALEQIRAPDERAKQLRQYGKSLPVSRHFQHLKDEYQSELEAVKKDLGVSQLPKKAGDLSRPQAKAQPKAESLRRLTEYRFLRDHEPAPVSPANLARFVAALPSWIREGLDPLPPDAARRRLQVLYRLVFPPGEEIPAPAPTAAAPPAPEAKRSVGTKPESVPPSSPSNPF